MKGEPLTCLTFVIGRILWPEIHFEGDAMLWAIFPKRKSLLMITIWRVSWFCPHIRCIFVPPTFTGESNVSSIIAGESNVSSIIAG